MSRRSINLFVTLAQVFPAGLAFAETRGRQHRKEYDGYCFAERITRVDAAHHESTRNS